MKKLTLGVLVSVAALLWWHEWPERKTPMQINTPSAQESSLPVSSVLRVRPSNAGKLPAEAPRPANSWRHAESAALAQFRDRTDYYDLYRAIESGPSAPEALYLRAEIYSLCAKRTTKSEIELRQKRANERDKFTASLLVGSDPTGQRLVAFDRLKRDPCEGVDVGNFDRETLARLVAAAADAGDPRAQAWQLAQRVETPYYDAQGVDRSNSGYRVNEVDFDEARRLLASGDPGVIADVSDLLSSSLTHGVVQLAGQPVDQEALHSALTLLACDAGARCGPDSTPILTNCAYRGRCDAGTVSEYMYYYETSPSQAQMINYYHQALVGMMNSGDFSGLTLADTDHVPGFSMVFGGRRVISPDEPSAAIVTGPPKKSPRTPAQGRPEP